MQEAKYHDKFHRFVFLFNGKEMQKSFFTEYQNGCFMIDGQSNVDYNLYIT